MRSFRRINGHEHVQELVDAPYRRFAQWMVVRHATTTKTAELGLTVVRQTALVATLAGLAPSYAHSWSEDASTGSLLKGLPRS